MTSLITIVAAIAAIVAACLYVLEVKNHRKTRDLLEELETITRKMSFDPESILSQLALIRSVLIQMRTDLDTVSKALEKPAN